MLQTNVREGYRITTLEIVKLVEDLTSYLAVAKCTQLQNAQILKVFHEAAARTIWTIMLAKVRYNTLTPTLSKTAQRQSSSVVSNRSTALITNKFSVASLTKPAILNNANIALVDAVHYSVIDALTITLIKDDDDLLGTVNSYIKSRRLRARCKTEAADSRHAKASGGRTKKDKDLEDSNTSSDVPRLRRRDRAAACAQSAERKQLGKEAQLKKTRDEEELAKAKKEKEEKENEGQSLCKSRDGNRTLHSRRLTDAYILYFKELSSNNSGIFANAIGIGKTRAIVLAVLIEHCDLSNLLALRFCFFSDSPPENIGRPTKEEAIEMQIDTTDAIFKALAAANKLVALQSYIILEANTPAVYSKATKHYLAPSAAQFVIVCSFRKVDKHVFRAYNTISVTAQRTIIRKGSPYVEKRAILLPDSVTSDHIYKIEDARNIIANVKHDVSKHESSYNCLCLDFLSTVQNAEQQCRDILEKEGLNKLEASRRVIFNCFKMQAIASYPALATLKAAYVKNLFTNLSKDYFLRDPDGPWIIVALMAFAEAIILTEATHVLAEMYVSIVYFNLDSELELKVLGKQDVKTTS
ncbi:hypothetical protein HBH50_087920 [Parastagonospora nodorum]|nr:hypothetical protein HBH50_087920 [Parastagonospora nodorum]KAH4092991.1 hypothetical protein HBH48_075410 [Parastagonospora nodorum]